MVRDVVVGESGMEFWGFVKVDVIECLVGPHAVNVFIFDEFFEYGMMSVVSVGVMSWRGRVVAVNVSKKDQGIFLYLC